MESKKHQQKRLHDSISEISIFCQVKNPETMTFACQVSENILQTLVLVDSSALSLSFQDKTRKNVEMRNTFYFPLQSKMCSIY